MGRVWTVLGFLLIMCHSASAVEVTGLYRAETIVTGTEEPERTRGFRIGLSDVIVKLTGDARLKNSPAIAPLLADPHKFVADFEYEDRMKDIPVHDEQGTRERPHYLRIVFKASEIDQAIGEIGLRKWPSERPLIALWLSVRTAMDSYILRATSDRGYGQRAVLQGAAKRFGIPIRLPSADGASTRISSEDVTSQNISKIRTVALGPDVEAHLLGHLALGAEGYWDIRWTLYWRDVSKRWSRKGVTFDAALKDGLQQSALIFSGSLK
ncbi:MAG: DUF2066 domain-containing protein [Methyloligellaceae bacterium]